jgi:hypothetical protein
MRAATQHALSPGLEGLPLPERVNDLIGRQLDRLGEPSRELVTQASVVGASSNSRCSSASPGSGKEVARGVEELTRRRLLCSVGEHFDFRTTSYRPVTFLAILSAASLDSPPVDRKKTFSRGRGRSSTTRRPSATTSGLSIALLMWSARSAALGTAWAMRG